MFRRISPSALAMLLVVVLTLATAIVFDERQPMDRGVVLAEASDQAATDSSVPATPSPPTPTAEPPERPAPPEPPLGASRANGGSARPAVAAAPDTVRDVAVELASFDASTFELAPFDFELADFDFSPTTEASDAGSPSSGEVEPDPVATDAPKAPTPVPTPSAVGPDARELVYPVGVAGDLVVAYDPRGIVEIVEVRPGPGWEVRNQAGWKKGVKVLFGSQSDPESDATIYVQIVDRQPVVTVTLPDPMPAT